MALGRVPRGTSKLVQRIQRFRSPNKLSMNGETVPLTNHVSKLAEADKVSYLTGKRFGSARKTSTFGKLPGDIPHGCLAVYVGNERRRYVISTEFLTHTLFKQLLKKSEEEFGFVYDGGLNVACESSLFEHLLWLIICKDPTARTTHLEDLIDSFEDGNYGNF